MAVKRWTLKDPYDTNPLTNSYLFPRNPETMSSPYPERSVSSMVTVAGKTLLYEGTTPAKQWTFQGPILDKAHFDALHKWVYDKKRRINLVDHYGRTINLVFISLSLEPKRTVNVYYSHTYTVTALINSISAPTALDTGPV